jgi:hypothetical protein
MAGAPAERRRRAFCLLFSRNSQVFEPAGGAAQVHSVGERVIPNESLWRLAQAP